MTFSYYHQKHTNRSDEETFRRIAVKKEELKKILAETDYKPGVEDIRIAVLGCADKRFVKLHKRIFEQLLRKKVELTTFDITTEHLHGEDNVIRHDVTTPIPNAPYDIAFGHVLLKFIKTEKQWDAIKMAYDSLRSPGLGIFVFDLDDVTTIGPIQTDGYYSVPVEIYRQKLIEEGIKYKILRWTIPLDKMSIPIRGLKGGALVIEK